MFNMEQAGPYAKGYLLKHNRDHRSSNIVPGAKYKRRWVEVTVDTMVYAPSHQDALTGKIQVFAMGDLVWVKPEGDNKFLVKFPERTLKFKVAAGGSAERDLWVGALQAAHEDHTAVQQARRNGAGKLEKLQKVLLAPESADPVTSSSTTGGLHLVSESGTAVLSSAGTTFDGSTLAGAASRGGSVPGLNLTGSSFGGFDRASAAGALGDRPPPPRTLLASARAGMALVQSTPRARTPPSAAAGGGPGAGQVSAHQHRQAQEHHTAGTALASYSSDDEDEEEDREADGDEGSSAAGSNNEGEQQEDGVQAAAASSAQRESAADDGSTPSSQRPSLVRRVTPGVLLVSSRPTTPASAAHSLPLTPSSSTHAASPLSAAPAPAANIAAKAVDVPDADEVLILDEPDSPAGAQQPTFLQAGHQASSSSSSRAQTPLTHGQQPARAVLPAAAGAAAAAATAAADPGATELKPSDVYSTMLYRPASGSRSRVASAGSASHGPVDVDEDLGLDDVLRLDEDEVLAAAPSRPSSSRQYNQQHQQQQQPQLGGSVGRGMSAEADSSGSSSLNLGSSRPGALQVSSRPGSAPTRPGSAYRPGTPLKSCLRNSPSTSLAPTSAQQLRTP